MSLDSPGRPAGPGLVRGIGLWHATVLNMIDMIGVGPFITIPLMVATMHGPQAMLGWVVGALLVTCDGMVVLRDGRHTGARPGKVLRRTPSKG